jgi:predicted acyltransferase
MAGAEEKLAFHRCEPSGAEVMPTPPETTRQDRLLSLDVFRGITLVGMVLVNNHPGPIYGPLGHVKWNGWGFADLIFPFFIFIVGVAIPYSLDKRRSQGAGRTAIVLTIFRRSILLFLLGLFLNGYPRFLNEFPHFDLAHLRIFNALQRIALCYFVASLLYLGCKPKTQAALGVFLLVFYYVMTAFVPVPGGHAGMLDFEDRQNNWNHYIDVRAMPGHMQTANWESKGLFSTLPAIATALIGLLTGQYLRSSAPVLRKLVNLYFFGAVGLFLGGLWSLFFPINQNLWTSSLVLLMGGMAMVVFASCYYVADFHKIAWWTPPFLVFGRNSLAVWTLTILLARTLEWIKVGGSGGTTTNLKRYLFHRLADSNILGIWTPGEWNGSLLFAIFYVLLFLGITGMLYRWKVFFKV